MSHQVEVKIPQLTLVTEVEKVSEILEFNFELTRLSSPEEIIISQYFTHIQCRLKYLVKNVRIHSSVNFRHERCAYTACTTAESIKLPEKHGVWKY
jgi:hypothetical protein